MSEFKPDIWRLQAQFNTKGLIEALSNRDAGIRKRAAAALRALGAYQAIPDLEKMLTRENDPEVRAITLAAIATLQLEKAGRESGQVTSPAQTRSERLIAELKATHDVDRVVRLTKALGDAGDKQAVEPLVILFNSPKTPIRVRLAVAEALLKLESAPVEVALLGALRSPEWRVRRNGAAILGQLRAEWAIEPLAHALRDENEIVRKTALAALRHIGTEESKQAIEVVRQALLKKKTSTTPRVATSEDKTPATPPTPAPASTGEKAPNLQWPNRKPITETRTRMQTRPLDPQKLDRLIESKKKKSDDSGGKPPQEPTPPK